MRPCHSADVSLDYCHKDVPASDTEESADVSTAGGCRLPQRSRTHRRRGRRNAQERDCCSQLRRQR